MSQESEELIKPSNLTEAMKGGLARMYADEDIRAYLVHAIAIANHNVLSSLKSGKTEAATDFAVRLETLKQLLDKGKSCFSTAEKLKSVPLEELVK
jgi:hypothetical protein